ncbi:MAG: RipA family octameric membrane protein, partial [Candidatus Heimdallarchaeota archaeon]
MPGKKSEKQKESAKKTNPLEKLFNSQEDIHDKTSLIFDQYKLYVDLADKISARRATTNSFYLTANSFLFVAIGILFSNGLEVVVPMILLIGVFVSISWWLLIIYYKNLNSSKY